MTLDASLYPLGLSVSIYTMGGLVTSSSNHPVSVKLSNEGSRGPWMGPQSCASCTSVSEEAGSSSSLPAPASGGTYGFREMPSLPHSQGFSEL